MAQLGAATALDQARMPALQLGQIQAGRVTARRWIAQHDCAAAGSLHVLLAPLLLVRIAQRQRGMICVVPLRVAIPTI
jgi:hypothetical protein